MISFWVTEEQSFGIRDYVGNRGRAIAEHVETRLYEEIGREVSFAGGPQIFSDLDQLSPSRRQAVAQIWDAHARVAPQAVRLNDPRRVLLRFELLTRLHAEGINGFRVFRADQVSALERFPVFVREIHCHNGPRTQLIDTRKDVARALLALRLRGFREQDLMIVEFCDASGPDGLVRKYSAFKVGDRIIPSHLFVSRDWRVKSSENLRTAASLRERLSFVTDHPHETWLRRVFDVAGIDYGRVDYGVADGVPQVWEINLNPTIGRPAGHGGHAALAPALKVLQDAARDTLDRRLLSAFLALDTAEPGASGRVSVDDVLRARLDKETARTRRRAATWRVLRGLYERERLGRPLRMAYSTLFRRR